MDGYGLDANSPRVIANVNTSEKAAASNGLLAAWRRGAASLPKWPVAGWPAGPIMARLPGQHVFVQNDG